MPDSVIKRLNEMALEDGRVKGKGELDGRLTSYDQDSDAKKRLPNTIEIVVNDGIDPAVAVLDGDEFADVIDNIPDVNEHQENSATDMTYDLNHPTYADDAIAPLRLPAKPKPDEMDDLIDSLKSLEVGPYVRTEDSYEMFDEQGVPIDYTSGSSAYTGSDETVGVQGSTERDMLEKRIMARPGQDVRMRHFRGGNGGLALLTRDYSRDGKDWGGHVFNISVNETLRTRGDAAVSVIEKELRQMINKKVWAPVDLRQMSREEKHRIIRSSMFLKEKFLASGDFEKLKTRLVAGGNQQDRDFYDDLSAPTVGTSSVFTLLSIAAHER